MSSGHFQQFKCWGPRQTFYHLDSKQTVDICEITNIYHITYTNHFPIHFHGKVVSDFGTPLYIFKDTTQYWITGYPPMVCIGNAVWLNHRVTYRVLRTQLELRRSRFIAQQCIGTVVMMLCSLLRWQEGKVFLMWFMHGCGAGLTSTKMNLSMSSSASMPLTWSMTTCASIPTIMRGWCHQALVGS